MSVRINTNIEALNAQRNLGIQAGSFAKSVEKLSSGLRINRAADDAAGLAISQKLDAQVRGLNQATRNAQDGISMVQTAEGALQEVQTMMQRMRELAVQGANSTLQDSDRSSIDQELQQLMDGINKISSSTSFNGQYMLQGSMTTSLAAGSGLKVGGLLTTTHTATVTKVDVAGAQAGKAYTITASGANVTLTRAGDLAAQTVAVADMAAGGSQTLSFSQLGVSISLQADAANAKTGADAATDLATAANVTTAAGSASATFQVGANAADAITVSFDKVALGNAAVGDTQGLDALYTALNAFHGATTTGNASSLIGAVDNALDKVSATRGKYGAYQNRLEHTIASLGVASENLSASQSRIKDLDVASEMVNFTKTQILQQAGTAILAQANQAPQNILSLLR